MDSISPPPPPVSNHFSGTITTFKVSKQKIICGNKPECTVVIPATHRRLPSWLPPNSPFRAGEGLWCPSSETLDQIPGQSVHQKPFRRLASLLGVSQETQAISWGYMYLRSSVCAILSETVTSKLLRLVSKLALGRSLVYQAENSRKDETKNL